jgi:excisionase family DNA binding protein
MTIADQSLTDEQIAALATLLLPYRERLETAWAGRTLSQGQTQRALRNVVPDLLDADMVAARLTCSRGHVYALVAAGYLARRDISAQGGSKMRITRKSVDEFIARDQKRGALPA